MLLAVDAYPLHLLLSIADHVAAVCTQLKACLLHSLACRKHLLPAVIF